MPADRELSDTSKQVENLRESLNWRDEELIIALKERDVALEQIKILTEILQRVVPQPYYCEDCGYFAGSDEDECCSVCGADLEIIGFHAAITAITEI